MNRKTLIAMIAGCLAVLLLLCVVLVGVLDGIWPWDGVTAYGRLITSRSQATVGPKETTDPTEDTTSQTDGNQQGAASGEQEEVKPTIGEAVQNSAPPSLPTEEDDIQTEIGGVVIPSQGSSGDQTDSTDPTTETTESTGSTQPTDEKADKEFDASQIPGR